MEWGDGMVDRKNVIKGLETCSQKTVLYVCGQCPYNNDDIDTYDCTQALTEDALSLLKEQEAVKIEVKKINDSGRCGRCPNCLMELNEMDYPNYCGFCGQAVKWDD